MSSTLLMGFCVHIFLLKCTCCSVLSKLKATVQHLTRGRELYYFLDKTILTPLDASELLRAILKVEHSENGL